MDSERWHRIQSLFHDAADVPQAGHRAFLEAACGDDEELTAEVLAMLDQDASGHPLSIATSPTLPRSHLRMPFPSNT